MPLPRRPATIGIDPGNVKSAIALYDHSKKHVGHLKKVDNADFFLALDQAMEYVLNGPYPVIIGIEQIRSYGMAVGATVFDTVHWSGRFHQYLIDEYGIDDNIYLVPRRDVKMHLCLNNRAKDTNVNQAIADRFGGMKTCKGTKKNPGPLYGIAGDMWAALGVALTVSDNLQDNKRYVEGCGSRK